ncbi:MAG: acyl-CoA dehydrogenase family protein [Herbiconiux sp.]|nr:acyl-CoA dehydrogenase family protein [Herbiconiux sp.]
MTTTDYERIAARFRPLFARIAAGERQREHDRHPPREELAALIAAGFAGLRVPEEHGGEDLPLSAVLRLVAELAEADANLAHLWRNHVSFIEDRRHDGGDPRSALRLRRLAAGELVGGGWSEPGAPGGERLSTTLIRSPDGLRLNGTKMYATGSLYADVSTVLALAPDGEKVVVLVDMRAAGVEVGDDWDGFGQRLTGSGSVTYRDVAVAPEDVFAFATRYPYQHQFYQSALNALLVGIGRAIVRDGAAALRARTRNHPSATVDAPTADPELLEVVGGIAAEVYAAESAFRRSLEALDATIDALDGPEQPAAHVERLLAESWIATSHAQLVASRSTLSAATEIFDALGSSGTGARFALDRHWRNARTVASHNPRPYRRRAIGDWIVNGTDPEAS